MCCLPYLKVHRIHVVLERMSLSHQLQHRGYLLRVVKVLHQSVDRTHNSVRVFPQLGTLLQLPHILDVLELAEVLLGVGEVHKQPVKEGR